MTTTYGKLQPSADVRTSADDGHTFIVGEYTSVGDGCSLPREDGNLAYRKKEFYFALLSFFRNSATIVAKLLHLGIKSK